MRKNSSENLHPKILFVGQLPPPVNGVSLMNTYIVNSKLINSNFHLECVDFKFSTTTSELQKFSFLKMYKAIYFGYIIVQKVLTKKPDLVHFTLCPTGIAFYRDAFYVVILKLLNSRIIFHLHGKGIKINAKKSFLNKYLYTWVFKNTYVICLSERLAEDISEVYRSVPYIVPNGIEVQQKFDGIVNQLNGSIPQILYLSNYKRDKGIHVLIEALCILKSKGFNFNARFVGEPGNLTIELIENIILDKQLKEFIQVSGPLYGDDKFLEFKKADIFVHPSYNDAFPLVILEAMQFSLPVISTFEGGIPELVIDGETGFLVETQNAQILAEKISILLKDKDSRIKMGLKGYERFINNYTLNHFENNMNKTFQSILGIN